MFIKTEILAIKRQELEDPEEVKLIEKLQGDLLDQKMIYENLQMLLDEHREEQKRQSLKQEA